MLNELLERGDRSMIWPDSGHIAGCLNRKRCRTLNTKKPKNESI